MMREGDGNVAARPAPPRPLQSICLGCRAGTLGEEKCPQTLLTHLILGWPATLVCENITV